MHQTTLLPSSVWMLKGATPTGLYDHQDKRHTTELGPWEDNVSSWEKSRAELAECGEAKMAKLHYHPCQLLRQNGTTFHSSLAKRRKQVEKYFILMNDVKLGSRPTTTPATTVVETRTRTRQAVFSCLVIFALLLCTAQCQLNK